MDQSSVRRIFNPAVPSLCPALASKSVLGCPQFKTTAKLLNSQLVASCYLEFLILLCSTVYLNYWCLFLTLLLEWSVFVNPVQYHNLSHFPCKNHITNLRVYKWH